MILKALQIYLEYVNFLKILDTVTSLEKKIKQMRKGKVQHTLTHWTAMEGSGAWLKWKERPASAHPYGWRPVGVTAGHKGTPRDM